MKGTKPPRGGRAVAWQEEYAPESWMNGARGCWEHRDTNTHPIAPSLDIFYMYNLPDVTEFARKHTVAFLHLYVGRETKTYSD